jgi:hypothetical protein
VQLKLKAALKTLWWIIVLCFIVIFLQSNLHRVEAVIQRLPISNIILSLLSLTFAKLLLVVIMQQSLQQHKIDFLFLKSFVIYNITQLGKYIPGSIWQFVGKISMYKSAGLNNQAVFNIILLETFWVVSSAFLLGLTLIGLTQYQILLTLLRKIPSFISLALLGVAATLLLIPQLMPYRRNLFDYWKRLLFTPQSFTTALLIWIVLGFSFWVTLTPFSSSEIGLFYIIGLYALSYAVGFVVPFAPAGIGIRESVMVFGLMPFLDINTSIILATLNRIFYIAIEIILAATATLLPRHSTMDRKKT